MIQVLQIGTGYSWIDHWFLRGDAVGTTFCHYCAAETTVSLYLPWVTVVTLFLCPALPTLVRHCTSPVPMYMYWSQKGIPLVGYLHIPLVVHLYICVLWHMSCSSGGTLYVWTDAATVCSLYCCVNLCQLECRYFCVFSDLWSTHITSESHLMRSKQLYT